MKVEILLTTEEGRAALSTAVNRVKAADGVVLDLTDADPDIRFARIPKGTKEGNSTVIMQVEHGDMVFNVQTTLKLLAGVADSMRLMDDREAGRFGSVEGGDPSHDCAVPMETIATVAVPNQSLLALVRWCADCGAIRVDAKPERGSKEMKGLVPLRLPRHPKTE